MLASWSKLPDSRGSRAVYYDLFELTNSHAIYIKFYVPHFRNSHIELTVKYYSTNTQNFKQRKFY